MNDLIPKFVTHPSPSDIYYSGNFVALDFEGDSDRKGSALLESNDIILACWTVYKGGKVVKKHKFGGIYEMGELVDDINSADFLLAFNAKFELQWLKRCGLELRDTLAYDPMLAQWVLDGNQKGKGFERSLKGMARRYGTSPKLDIVGLLLDAGVATRDINTAWLLEYCERDVDTMVEIFFKQLKVVEERNVFHLVHTRNLTCAVLADIEFNGLELDKDVVEAEYAKAKARHAAISNELAEMTGGVNVNSPKQLGDYLYDVLEFKELRDKGKVVKTDSGGRSASMPVIFKLEITTDKQRKFVELYKEYNKIDTLLSKNLEFFKKVCEHMDGRFQGTIKQNSVISHRLASSGIKYKFPVSEKVDKKGKVTVKYKEMSVKYSASLTRGNEQTV